MPSYLRNTLLTIPNFRREPSPLPSSQSISLASALPRAEVHHSWWPSRPRLAWLEITFPFCMAKVSLTVSNPTGECSLHKLYINYFFVCVLCLCFTCSISKSLSLSLSHFVQHYFLWLPPLALCNPKTTSRSSPPPIKVVNQSNLFLSLFLWLWLTVFSPWLTTLLTWWWFPPPSLAQKFSLCLL